MLKVFQGMKLHDFLFFVLIVFSFYFTRNAICSFLMIAFLGYTVLVTIMEEKTVIVPRAWLLQLFFIIYGVGNIIINNVLYPDVATIMVKSLFFNWIMIWAVVQYIYLKNDTKQVLRIFELSILIINLIVIVMSLGTLTTGRRLGTQTEINANFMAMLCVFGFVLAYYLYKTSIIQFKECSVRFLVYLSSILLTGSRKGIIMIVVAILVINLANENTKLLKTIFKTIFVSFALYILIMYVPVFYNIIGARVENLITLLTEGSTSEGSLNSRKFLVERGMEYIKLKPWTGYGFDCFKMVSGVSGGGKVSVGELGYYSHNNYIELLFGGGIIGLVLYYVPFTLLLIELIKVRKVDNSVIYLLAILISKLVVEYAYVSYYNRLDAYIVGIIIGCLTIVKKNQRNTEKER